MVKKTKKKSSRRVTQKQSQKVIINIGRGAAAARKTANYQRRRAVTTPNLNPVAALQSVQTAISGNLASLEQQRAQINSIASGQNKAELMMSNMARTQEQYVNKSEFDATIRAMQPMQITPMGQPRQAVQKRGNAGNMTPLQAASIMSKVHATAGNFHPPVASASSAGISGVPIQRPTATVPGEATAPNKRLPRGKGKSMAVEDLKRELKELELKSTGRKYQLERRLQRAVREDWKERGIFESEPNVPDSTSDSTSGGEYLPRRVMFRQENVRLTGSQMGAMSQSHMSGEYD